MHFLFKTTDRGIIRYIYFIKGSFLVIVNVLNIFAIYAVLIKNIMIFILLFATSGATNFASGTIIVTIHFSFTPDFVVESKTKEKFRDKLPDNQETKKKKIVRLLKSTGLVDFKVDFATFRIYKNLFYNLKVLFLAICLK